MPKLILLVAGKDGVVLLDQHYYIKVYLVRQNEAPVLIKSELTDYLP